MWALGSDDSHNVEDDTQTGVMWTSVATSSACPESLTVALRQGRHVAIRGERGVADVQLRSVDVDQRGVTVRFAGSVTEIRFIGDHGRVLATVSGADARYEFSTNDSYVRVVARGANATLYLNPVVRYDGVSLISPEARPDRPVLWGLRLLLWSILLQPTLAAVASPVTVLYRAIYSERARRRARRVAIS